MTRHSFPPTKTLLSGASLSLNPRPRIRRWVPPASLPRGCFQSPVVTSSITWRRGPAPVRRSVSLPVLGGEGGHPGRSGGVPGVRAGTRTGAETTPIPGAAPATPPPASARAAASGPGVARHPARPPAPARGRRRRMFVLAGRGPCGAVLMEQSLECFRRVNSGGECGGPRGRRGRMHGVRGASGGVPARGPGVSPDLCPRARPSPPVFTLLGNTPLTGLGT